MGQSLCMDEMVIKLAYQVFGKTEKKTGFDIFFMFSIKGNKILQ